MESRRITISLTRSGHPMVSILRRNTGMISGWHTDTDYHADRAAGRPVWPPKRQRSYPI